MAKSDVVVSGYLFWIETDKMRIISTVPDVCRLNSMVDVHVLKISSPTVFDCSRLYQSRRLPMQNSRGHRLTTTVCSVDEHRGQSNFFVTWFLVSR